MNFESERMNSPPFAVHAVIDHVATAYTLIDSGCLSYGAISQRFVRRNGLPTFDITPKLMRGATGGEGKIDRIVRCRIDIEGHSEQGTFLYVIPDHLGYDLILGRPWLNYHDVLMYSKRGRLHVRSTGAKLRDRKRKPLPKLDILQVCAATMSLMIRRTSRTKYKNTWQCFAVTMKDIQKALAPKKHTDPRTKLPLEYREYLELFEPKNATTLPPHRGPGIDHDIELVRKDGKEPEVPWGPLYNMTQDELVVLKATLTDLLDKNFIRVSHSSAAAPVLFVRKPGGGLRFCVDYRALNAITKKDRYPLPLIHETLNQIGKARWFTKLDVSAAFHKIRIAEGKEWMTAFRTRYGLYEWLVTPFGLANAPSTFQKYINWTLREHLDDFCSAYIDDVLIYSSGTVEDHRTKVKIVLEKLSSAGLFLDIGKCEFEVKETKYLGFIVRAGEGIQMDPEKVKAVAKWAPPTTVKGVRGFLGFANFYRRFIPDFSAVVRPLTDLTHKDMEFRWSNKCQKAFEKMKKLFVEGPILATFDPLRTTVVETDSSGYNVGGVLSQIDDEGILRPCAYYSKKNAPAECNYEIYDKELLAVVRCLEEWDSELRAVSEFEVVTDHKNLEYFFSPRKLTERHVRWQLLLSRFNFHFKYRPGKDNGAADALSRREQDNPQKEDGRVESRTIQLLNQPVRGRVEPLAPIQVREEEGSTQPPSYDDARLWDEARAQDEIFQEAESVVREGGRKFPSHLQLKVSVAECAIDNDNYLLFRGRRWVPNFESLRTTIIQHAHDSAIAGHPGREQTYSFVARNFFWPNMSQDIRRFVRNCNVCGRSKAFRDQRKGLLKPLPIPVRPWQEISMDFVTDLPESEGCRDILVITDRLTRGVILEGVIDMTAETLARTVIQNVVRRHGFPRTITSDRGTQFVGELWSSVCRLANITKRLSTAYHPQTDGATERLNSSMETYLRTYVCFDQTNWKTLLPMAELSMNSRTNATTGVSPFFLTHGFENSPFDPDIEEQIGEDETRAQTPAEKGEQIVRTLRDAMDWAKASMAFAQQEAERQANRRRSPAPEFQVGDKVWLHLKNIRTIRPCRKLDWKNAKYTVREVIGTHAVRLDTPMGIHDVFHVDLIHLAAEDPLPSQRSDDTQPPAIQVDGEEEYQVEEIVNESRTRRGRGWQVKYLVRWTGYARETWESAVQLAETIALDRWLEKTQPFRNTDGSLDARAMASMN